MLEPVHVPRPVDGLLVRCPDGSLLIHDHVVSDVEVLRHFGDSPDAATLDRMLRLGSSVMAHATGVALVELLDTRAASLEREVTAAGSRLDAHTTDLVRQLTADVGVHARELAAVFDPATAGSLADRMVAEMAARVDVTAASLFARLCDGDMAPLALMRGEVAGLRTEIAGVRERFAAEQAGGMERRLSPAKGLDFETTLFDALATIARPLGDTVTRVGTEPVPEVPGRKVGDILVRLDLRQTGGVPLTMAIEAKDRSLSLPGLRRELEAALDVRSAAVAFAVFADGGQMPRSLHPLGEVTPVTLAMCFDRDDPPGLPLLLGYRYARLLTLMAWRAGTSDALSVSDVAASMERIRAALTAIRNLKTSVTHMEGAVRSGADKVRTGLDQLQQSIDTELGALEARLQIEGGAA